MYVCVYIYLYTFVVLSCRENSSNGAPQCENKALPISKHQIMKLISVISKHHIHERIE
jgi:hypothetical protein